MSEKIDTTTIDGYINQLNSYSTTKKLVTWILTGNIDKVILGEEPFSVATRWDNSPVNPSQMMWIFYMLLRDGEITNDQINEAFSRVQIKSNSFNVCLILDYCFSYIIFLKKVDDLLKIDFANFIKQINEDIYTYKSQPCVRYLTQKINEESVEKIFPDLA
ncbi:hypothetical protein [Spirosoma linguale]|uniref:Uncharacterized protein n=1 Tax=Spirosoma linguale (strain ATCC 33905 / DSM 74 / LMG 10896 / Claus 1) TaxID=504472 RepID=D2QLJ0_SPILD|nr:hypothetical protein Slin_4298 [Spirosoma linguale DSM 74]